MFWGFSAQSSCSSLLRTPRLAVWFVSLNFLHVFTLFVINIHQIRLISLFPISSHSTHLLFGQSHSTPSFFLRYTEDLPTLKQAPTILGWMMSRRQGSTSPPGRQDILPLACIANLSRIHLQNNFHPSLIKTIDLQQTLFSSPSQLSFVNFERSSRHSGVNDVKASRLDCSSLKAGQSSLSLQCQPASHSPENVTRM